MREILPADRTLKRVLGKQTYKEEKRYRLLTYCVACEVLEGTLLYNNLTKRMVLLSPEEAAHLTRLKDGEGWTGWTEWEGRELLEDWFFVPEGGDDRKIVKELRAILPCLQKGKPALTSYTIFTTMACNARCAYCYERGRRKPAMSMETADRTAQFILRNCGKKAVSLGWFGGEPLYNVGVIDRICGRLKEAGAAWQSHMISNGYLFDEEMVQRAVSDWKLKKVQITLDGTEEIYNRSKAYIYKEGNPYARVMDSIALLLDAGIHVTIRLNLSEQNGEDLLDVVDELAARFGGSGHLSAYAKPLLEQEDRSLGEYGWSAAVPLYETWERLRQRIAERGLAGRGRLSRQFRLTGCMADNDRAVTILPEGQVGLCEHFSEREFIGTIESEVWDEAVRSSWKERIADGEICGTCTCYPDCIRLKKCPSGQVCIPPERRAREEDLRTGILREYESFKEKEKKG